jgi:hypothetical protein
MSTSSIAMLLRQIAVCLAELVRSADVTDRAELQSIQDLLEAKRRESASLRRTMAEERTSLAAFEERAATLQASFQGIERHFTDLIGSAAQTLRHRLCGLVRDFAEDQAGALLDALAAKPRLNAWRCEVLPLREQMEEAYLASFRQSAADLVRVEQFLYPQLKVIVSSLLPDYRGKLLEAPAWPSGDVPPAASLAHRVAVDLDMPWWQHWFAARRSAEERADHLRRLIEDDFFRIADALVGEAEAQLRQRVSYIMERINAISMGLRSGIERRSTHLSREHVLLDEDADEDSLRRFEEEQRRRAEDCVRKQDAYAAALGELQSILEMLDASPGEPRNLQ